MGVRYRRGLDAVDDGALRELAQIAYRGRSLTIGSARVRKLLKEGERLGMTVGDTITLANATLTAIDTVGQFEPAMQAVLDAFDAGEITTEMREPLNHYLDRPAVAALAVFTHEQCRPGVPIAVADQSNEVDHTAGRDPLDQPGRAGRDVADEPVRTGSRIRGSNSYRDEPAGSPARIQLDGAAHWPERTVDGFPRITLDVLAWWPGLARWEPLTLVASVTQSLAFSGDNFSLLISQPGDERPERTNAAWLVRREDVSFAIPVFELRASTWEIGDDDAHHYRFLIASSSDWCRELHDYLATRWISHGQNPNGPPDFDEPYALNPPPLTALPTA